MAEGSLPLAFMKACWGSTGARSRIGMMLAGSQRCLARRGGHLAVGGTEGLLLVGARQLY